MPEASAAPRVAVDACRPEAWLAEVPGLVGSTVKRLADLNGDGLPEYAIAQREAGSPPRAGETMILTSTGGTDCFRVVYVGEAQFDRVLPTRTAGWLDIAVGGMTLTPLRGSARGSWRARYDGQAYQVAEALECLGLVGQTVAPNECPFRLVEPDLSLAKSAEHEARAIRSAAQRWQAENGTAQCPSMEQLVATRELDRVQNDPWGRPYRLHCTEVEIIAVSAGADGKEGSADDIVIPKDLGPQGTPSQGSSK